ncbi:hypothetical protein [Paraoerskovia marina]|uniref:hypothetical protein n=1 Tax=Paraoerskovia marina TaxID=545619 RepID=UPI0004929AF6|nr:hypothetical protein [Paraoerskovia marina]
MTASTPHDLARTILAQPPYGRPTYRALTAEDGPPAPGFMITAATPTTSDPQLVAAVPGIRWLVAFMNYTARDISGLTGDLTGSEVAVLPGAVFGAVGSFRPEGAPFDVLVAAEMVREPMPDPVWPADNAGMERMVLEALFAPSLPSTEDPAKYTGPFAWETPQG